MIYDFAFFEPKTKHLRYALDDEAMISAIRLRSIATLNMSKETYTLCMWDSLITSRWLGDKDLLSLVSIIFATVDMLLLRIAGTSVWLAVRIIAVAMMGKP